MRKHFKLGWSRTSEIDLAAMPRLATDIDALLLHVDWMHPAADQIHLLSKLRIPIYLTSRRINLEKEKQLLTLCGDKPDKRRGVMSIAGELVRLTTDTIIMGSEGWPEPSGSWHYQALEIWLRLAAEGANHIILASPDVPSFGRLTQGTNLALGDVLGRFCREHPEISLTVLCPVESNFQHLRRFSNLHMRGFESNMPYIEILHLPQ